MRRLSKVVAALVALFSVAEHAPAQQADGWVGQRVITKVGTVLMVGRQVVDDPYRQARPPAADRPVVPVYRVERVNGTWLWLVPEKRGTSGWVKASQAVPYDHAMDYFTGEIRAHPGDPTAYFHRGSLWYEEMQYQPGQAADPSWHEKAQFDKAIADFTAAIRLETGSARAYLARADAWREQGDLHRAIADYDEAVRLDPKNARASAGRHLAWENLFTQGVARGKIGEYDKAIADFNEVIRIEPGDAAAHANRGNAWKLKGEYDRAIGDFDEAIRLDPNSVLAYEMRACAWQSKGEYDKALADLTTATRLNAREALAH
jgi:tetratricopeptide (TPR) repeat protein